MHEEDEATLRVYEEKLNVGLHSVPTGRVRVRTETETVDVRAEALLEAEFVEVTRVAVGREVSEPPAIRTEGDMTIVPVVEEVAVLEKRLVLKEEIRIRHVRRRDRVEIPASVRRQHAVIERETRDDTTTTSARNESMADLSKSYDQTYGVSGGGSSVSAFFDTRAEAEAAIARLKAQGIPDASIRLTEGASEGKVAQPEPRGFFESLADLFMPNEDRYTYAEGLARGGYLVVVTRLAGSEYDMALDILDDEGAVDLDARSEAWRAEGWGGYDAAGMASAGTAAGTMRGTEAGMATGFAEDATRFGAEDAGRAFGEEHAGRAFGDDEAIPVIEERIRVGKRDVSHGRVRVRSYVVEEPVSEEVELSEDRVYVERRPVDRPLSDADEAFRERVIEAEEHVEEAVVSKEARVVEEIGLRREHDSRRETVSDTVRHTEVEVEDDRGTDRRPEFERNR